jgi:hypothetical protein
MKLSEEIISLLEVLEEAEVGIDFAIAAVEGRIEYGKEIDPEKHREYVELAKLGRKFIRGMAETKLKPMLGLNDEHLQTLMETIGDDDIGDDDLDAHFTTHALAQIPHVVARWRKLGTIPVAVIPENRVTGYLRQASECYLYGLLTAAAILCRTVLQFTLQEAIPNLGGVSLGEVDRGDWLMKLINLASSTKTLPPTLVEKAHHIRKVGNEAAHSGTCSETVALAAMRETADILTRLYGKPTDGG